MNQATLIKTLDEILDPTLEYLTSSGAIEVVYNGSRNKLTRDLSCLKHLKLEGFNHIPRSKGFDRSTLNIMWEFRQLVEKFGYESAVKRIRGEI